MTLLFYVSSIVAVIAAAMVVTRVNATHALLYLVLLFLSIASIFFTLGAPFVAVLQIVVYAGAIMVLFVFVVMMLNLGHEAVEQERTWLRQGVWAMPMVLSAVLLGVFLYALRTPQQELAGITVGPKLVGVSLFTTYFIGVELASILLLAALVAAFHFGILPTRIEASDEYHTD